MPATPSIATRATADSVTLTLSGDWTIRAGAKLERAAAQAAAAGGAHARAIFDISAIRSLDTAGAWVIDRARAGLQSSGVATEFLGLRAEHAALFAEARYRPSAAPPPPGAGLGLMLLADIGETVAGAGWDVVTRLGFLGEIIATGLASALHPSRWRITPIVFHIENFALRSTPIILLINFFVGAIVAQQGIFQLSKFGAASLSVDLVAILTLRELGVLLTSIMVAGRSGSAITAELGAMKMREEIDAMRVMAVDPVEALVLPRLIALIVAVPALTFLGDIAALFGGMIVSWIHGDATPYSYLMRLQHPWTAERFAVGMVKAPFMAMVVGVIACAEGFSVEGSAESLGSRVTASVVKAIFTVIVLDGLLASFFVMVNF